MSESQGVRRRAIAAIGALVAALLLAVANLSLGSQLLAIPSGFLLLAAIALGAALFFPALSIPAMPGLFQKPSTTQRWCSACGRVAPRTRVCICGSLPPVKRNFMSRRPKTKATEKK